MHSDPDKTTTDRIEQRGAIPLQTRLTDMEVDIKAIRVQNVVANDQLHKILEAMAPLKLRVWALERVVYGIIAIASVVLVGIGISSVYNPQSQTKREPPVYVSPQKTPAKQPQPTTHTP